MSESNWLADQFLRSVDGLAWHGPDLTETLKGVYAQGKTPYFPIDKHWNPDGHAAVAAALAPIVTGLVK